MQEHSFPIVPLGLEELLLDWMTLKGTSSWDILEFESRDGRMERIYRVIR